MSVHKEKIDFVLIWVDGNDPKWQSEYLKYKGENGDQRSIRFRDTDTLQYWFRGVEKFAPWVNNIYFVTCGHYPKWLNINHPKLKFVRHDEYIPEKYLPTFSSHTIELNLHRIKNLSDKFVYFNDDMFIVKPMEPTDFFLHGLPCDAAVMNCFSPIKRPMFLVPFSNACLINNHFKKIDVLRKNWRKFFSLKYGKHIFKNFQYIPGKYFPGLKWYHIPTSFLKKSFYDVWEAEYDLLDSTCTHKFRVLTDVNQWVIQDWQRCKGDFWPRTNKVGKYCLIDSEESLNEATRMINCSGYKMICLNDEGMEDFELMKSELKKAFEQLLPEKSSFEI
jgi:hypothetical protein